MVEEKTNGAKSWYLDKVKKKVNHKRWDDIRQSGRRNMEQCSSRQTRVEKVGGGFCRLANRSTKNKEKSYTIIRSVDHPPYKMSTISGPALPHKPVVALGSIPVIVMEGFRYSEHWRLPYSRLSSDDLHSHSVLAHPVEFCRGVDISP
ncbi:hypothetical protein EVAR_71372_1 [Eumeta japonica]|uniref:Uncharacterized protein n=1 Tax=Eumeta variegata TaxID=151549 RepID=A0A4C2A759_EUMVA|nr:hypothetical protein EVAR_71372_1 [Eumeta japonica]